MKLSTYREGVDEQEDKQHQQENEQTNDEVPLVVGPDDVTQGLEW